MAEIFEIIMLVLFGVSWPMNIVRSVRTKTAKGKSVLFLILILVGYFAGIAAKLLNPDYLENIAEKWYVLFFYILNTVMVAIDIGLYFRNHHLDTLHEKQKNGSNTEDSSEQGEQEQQDNQSDTEKDSSEQGDKT